MISTLVTLLYKRQCSVIFFCFHEQYFEFQEKDFCTSATKFYVKGRLNENIGFWRSIGANPEILKVLQEGYKIPFFETPAESFFKK